VQFSRNRLIAYYEEWKWIRTLQFAVIVNTLNNTNLVQFLTVLSSVQLVT